MLFRSREVAGFLQLDTDIDPATEKLIYEGRLLTEALKQKQNKPLSILEQAYILYAVLNGYFETTSTSDLKTFSAFEEKLLKHLRTFWLWQALINYQDDDFDLNDTSLDEFLSLNAIVTTLS